MVEELSKTELNAGWQVIEDIIGIGSKEVAVTVRPDGELPHPSHSPYP